MKLTEKQQKRAIKGMIQKFTDNFAWRDLEAVYWRSQNLTFGEYMQEFSKYSIKESYGEFNKLIEEIKLQKQAPENKGMKMHGMRIERGDLAFDLL